MNVLICICASNRPILLQKTLNSFKNLKIPDTVNLIIYLIDNNIHKKNKIIYQKFKNEKKFKLFYSYELKKGIVHARNNFLNKLKFLKIRVDYIGFTDDDCIIPNYWLQNHMKTFKSYNCDISTGPQKIQNLKEIIQIYDLMNKNLMHNFVNTDWAATNNVLIKFSKFKKIKIKFDTFLNNVGGSDQLFFSILNKKGFKIFWNKKAYVYENTQLKNIREDWLYHRNIRYGYSNAYMNKILYGKKLGLLFSALKLSYLFIKIISSFISIFDSQKKIKLKLFKFRIKGILKYYFGRKINRYY